MQVLINAILRFRNALIFALLLSFSLVFLSNRSDYHQTQLKKVGLWFSGSVFEFQTSIADYFSLSRKNLELTQENTRLQEELIQLRNQETPRLSGANFNVIQARILRGSFKEARNMLVLNKGQKDGVAPEMGIISAQGVVGVTKATTAGFSNGLSLLHKDLRINAKLKNTEAFGSLFWEGTEPTIMRLIDVATINKVAIGDTIVTGGMSNYFPPDIPIGKVFNYTVLPSKRYYEIDVQLFHNFTQIGEVYILKNLNKEEIEALN